MESKKTQSSKNSGENEDEKKLDATAKNSTQECFTFSGSDGVDGNDGVNRDENKPEEEEVKRVNKPAGESEVGPRSHGTIVSKKELMNRQGFINYTEGDFIKR